MRSFLLFILFLICLNDLQAGRKKIKIITSKGTIVVELYNETPLHRDNFLKLVKKKFYDSVLFHRVISGFMVQAGDPESKAAVPGMRYGSGGLNYRVPAEFRSELFHGRGALAAARDNNPEKASSSCQFYIVQGRKFKEEDLRNMLSGMQSGRTFSEEQIKVYTSEGGSPHLDGNYTVFGKVTEGMDVVDLIASAKRDNYDRPLEDIRIIRMRKVRRFLFF
jgi:cyclophilin family peptidyl-prolyl cis-trans isomerase